MREKAYIYGIRVPVRFALAWARWWARILP